MFIDASSVIHNNRPRRAAGVAVTDADGDGALELVVGGWGQANLILRWDGRRLIDSADGVAADPEGYVRGLAAGDIDGDGREELYILNAPPTGSKPGRDRLLSGFGNRWIDLLSGADVVMPPAQGQGQGRSVAVIDRWGRGRYELVVGGTGGPLRLYGMDRRGHIIDQAEEAGLDLPAAVRALLPLPLVSGGMDLLVLNGSGSHYLFANDGAGGFEDVAAAWGLVEAVTHGRCVAALDGDGRFDLVVGARHAPNRLLSIRAGGGFADLAPPDLAEPGAVRTVLAADFDNDGYQELFFNLHGEPNRLFAWRHDQWQAVDAGDALLPRGLGTGAVAADLDGDGRLELLVAHGDGGDQPLALFRPVPTDFDWLRVMPLTPAGAPARGALVTCTAGGRTQRRAICAGSGPLCQMEPVAHFGLGEAGGADRVDVQWPDGAVAVVERPPVRRLLTVPHPRP